MPIPFAYRSNYTFIYEPERPNNNWSAVKPSFASEVFSQIRRKDLYGKHLIIEDMLPCQQSDGMVLWVAVN